MRDSAEYSTIVRNEILYLPVPEHVTHVMVHAPKCEVPCVCMPLVHPSLAPPARPVRALNLTISIVGTARRKRKRKRKIKRST